MVDLRSQYLKIKDEIDIAIEDVIRSAQYINGPQVHQFEQNLGSYLGNAEVIGCANGTDALQIALMALELELGDEVIVPSFTYVSCAEVIALLNFKPVWVDVDPDTYNIDVAKIEAVITPKTRVVIVVHLFGQCASMEPLLTLSKSKNFYIIEDNAQSLGAEYKFADQHVQKAGTIGHIGCTSFFPTKILGCFGDGGALITKDMEIADRIRMIASHGQKRKYHHDLVGVNSRLDSIQAAVLNVKLKYISQFIKARLSAANKYDELLTNVSWLQKPLRSQYSTHVFNQYTIKINTNIDRDALKRYLFAKGIPTMVYYPLSLPQQKAYMQFQQQCDTFSVSDTLCTQVLSLPIHTELDSDTQHYIVETIKSFRN